MSNIAIFRLNQTPQYLTSVNGAEYMVNPSALEGNVVSNDSDVLINPDITAVRNVPLKYWRKVGSAIVEMDEAEKATVDAADLAARKLAADEFQVSLKDAFTALITVINIRLSTNQKITKAEMAAAIKAVIT